MIIHVFLNAQSGPVCLDSFLQEVCKLVRLIKKIKLIGA